jgi:glycosyltransferase involved in cell wall biosynthesis
VSEGSFFRPAHQWRLPALLRRGSYDLLHSPDFLVPLWSPVPVVCTIHDIIPLVHPEFIPRSMKVRMLPLFRAWARHAARRSAAVITDSAHSRGDIVRLLGADPGRIAVVPLAPTLEPTRAPLPPALAALLRPGRYFLYVGRHDPYKGLAHLLRAFAAARAAASGNGSGRGNAAEREDAGQRGGEGMRGVRLAVAGRSDPRYGYGALVEELGLGDAVVFLDYVAAGALSPLYANALAYVHPSLYEGFGLPPLDAMRHGTAVICSDRSSLPEVVGDAAMLVDPENVKAFADALGEITENATLRRELIRNGLIHVQRFSWNLTAKNTVDVYMHASPLANSSHVSDDP